MKKYILLVCFICIYISAFSQKNAIKLVIKEFKVDKDSLDFLYEIKNDSTKGVMFLKLDINDLCFNILDIEFIDLKNGEKYHIIPCLNVLDLNCIFIESKDCVYLYPNELFRQHLKVSKCNAQFLKKKKKYKIRMSYHLKGVKIKTEVKEIYQKNMISNLFEFNN